MRKRGGSLALVLAALTTTLILLSFCLVSSLNHYQLGNSLDQRARARDQAESLINQAIYQLCKTPSWGGAGETLEHSEINGKTEVYGLLSFDMATAHGVHIPRSTNNLEGTAPAAGEGIQVPSTAAHLVALGQCGSSKVQIETIFVRPPYPTGLAAQGPVELRAVRLWGLEPNQPPPSPLIPDPWNPANVFTNRAGPLALQMDGQTEVFGNAVAVGDIVAQTGCIVRGDICPRSRQREMAHFDIPAMWARVGAYAGMIPYVEGRKLSSFCVVDGPLNVVGDLELDGGLVAVRGNLTVGGKMKGRGAVIVTGSVTSRAGADLHADQRLALLCGGDLTLTGDGQDYYFNGLVYSKGAVEAHDITVVGAMVADGATGNERVLLDHVSVVRSMNGIRGNIGVPHNTGTRHNANVPRLGGGDQDEAMVMSLQSYYLNESPLVARFTGIVEVHDNKIIGNQTRWPPDDPADRTWRVVFSPPEARLYACRNSNQLDGNFIRSIPCDGSAASVLSAFHQLINDGGTPVVGAFGQDHGQTARAEANLRTYLNVGLEPFHRDLTLPADLNNLMPPIEATRCLLWRESAPTR